MLPKKAYYLGFSYLPTIGPQTFKKILSVVPDIASAWHYPHRWLGLINHERQTAVQAMIKTTSLIDEWSRLIESPYKMSILGEADYPALLKEIPDAPHSLFWQGAPIRSLVNISIVGTRKISSYGEQVLHQLIPPLVNQGIGIISGLAFGIDALSHQLAIDQGGYTAAVIASPIDEISPKGNDYLAQKILNHGGTIISEFPPFHPIVKFVYARRNRILAGLTPLTLVVEAAETSGSLITAQYALQYNREVAAIPGSIFANGSIGTNKLIDQGAKMITGYETILDQLHLSCQPIILPVQELSPIEEQIIALIKDQPRVLDQLQQALNMPTASLLPYLATMELKGLIRRTDGGYIAAR